MTAARKRFWAPVTIALIIACIGFAGYATAATFATKDPKHHVIICHVTGSANHPFVAINVAYEGGWVDGHDAHAGDFILKDPADPGEHLPDADCGGQTASTSTSTSTSTETSTPTSTSTSTSRSSSTSTNGTTSTAPTTSSGGGGTTSTSGVAGTTTSSGNGGTGSTTTTGPLTPPTVPCPDGAIRVSQSAIIVGRSTVVVIRVLADGRPLAHATVKILGAGVSATRVTDANGVVRLRLSARSAGVIRLQVVVPGSCPATSRLLRAVASFRPPMPNFTG